MDNIKIGKFMSLILRHKPEVINAKLDSHGWLSVSALIDGVNKKFSGFTFELLDKIVASDEKSRFSFNEDRTKIRANQGHSLCGDLELKNIRPPDMLFHGTAEKNESSIKAEGILHKNRQYVHLSKDLDTAFGVGIRHGSPIIYIIDAKKMYEDGYEFFLSENGIWLTENVPAKYLVKYNN